MVMLGKNPSRRASSRSARLSSSISHTVASPRQRPQAAKTSARPQLPRQLSAKALKSLQSKRTRKTRPPRKKLTPSEYSLLGIIGTSAVCILSALIVSFTFDPAGAAEKAMSDLADDYYIEFLYPRVLGSHIDEPASILAKYSESGLPSVRLSQLLLYNDASHASYSTYFDNKYYKCDAGRSYFSFHPVAPYGPRDYTVEYSPTCEKVL